MAFAPKFRRKFSLSVAIAVACILVGLFFAISHRLENEKKKPTVRWVEMLGFFVEA